MADSSVTDTGPEAPRDGELTAVVRRDRFDELPGGLDPAVHGERWRAFREAYHRAQKLEPPDGFPLQIDFELNSTCNMKCGFCVHGQEKVPRAELSFEDFARVIDEGAQHGLCSIKLNYINEPLLRKDIARFIRYARDAGVLNVYFASNGSLLTREVSRELIEAELSKVMVSLDAATSKTFSLMRRSSRFDQIRDNIFELIDMRREMGVDYPLVRVNFLRTKLNRHEEDEFLETWAGVADMIGFQQQVRVPGVDDDLLGVVDPDAFGCAFPFKLLVVDSSGDILPCCTFNGRDMPIGNIAEMTIAEAWRSSKMNELRGLHQTGRGLTNPVCAHCMGC